MPDPKQALILAAGLGSRLGGKDTLKPLVEVKGKALILRTIDTLCAGGCEEIIIVLGYAADTIRHYIERHYHGPARIRYALNAQYRLSNGLSILAARDLLAERFVLSMADHLFSAQIPFLLQHTALPEQGATLFVDYKINRIFDLDDATKVREKEGKILAIGKQLQDYNCIDTGLFLATRDLVAALSGVYHNTGDASISDGMTQLARERKAHTLDIGNACWQDVDDPSMLEAGWKLISHCESNDPA